MKFKYVILFINIFTFCIANAEDKTNLNNTIFDNIHDDLVRIRDSQKYNYDLSLTKYNNDNK